MANLFSSTENISPVEEKFGLKDIGGNGSRPEGTALKKQIGEKK